MQNKPKVKIGKMNITSYITENYENKTNWTLGKRGKNKAKQTQPVVSLVSPIILVLLNWLYIISFSVMVR
jgi:hypothetical protein